jgi:ABC-type nitrate/sulfonate/bicarbonate transport system permease component
MRQEKWEIMSQAERAKIEAEHFGISPGKVGLRTPSFFLNQGPSLWRRSLKGWAALVLGFILGGITAGIVAVLMGVTR